MPRHWRQAPHWREPGRKPVLVTAGAARRRARGRFFRRAVDWLAGLCALATICLLVVYALFQMAEA